MLVSLLELGVKYHITNSTVLELIQSILLLSFAVGVFPPEYIVMLSSGLFLLHLFQKFTVGYG
jgi:hypothetical protein